MKVDVYTIAESNGIIIEETGHSQCEISEDGKIKIKVIHRWTEERKRFAVAHELGHIALKHPFTKQGDVWVSPDRPWKLEREANAWAIQLLMPEKDVRLAFNAFDTVVEMASVFGVDFETLVYRLRDLRLISS